MSASNFPATCRLCKKPLVLSIDDSYSDMGDALKLLPMATCNPCFDNREQRRKFGTEIEKSCWQLHSLATSKNPKAKTIRPQIREALEASTRGYAKAFAQFHHSTSALWDGQFVEMLMEKPSQWRKTINLYHSQALHHFKESSHRGKFSDIPALPYSDA